MQLAKPIAHPNNGFVVMRSALQPRASGKTCLAADANRWAAQVTVSPARSASAYRGGAICAGGRGGVEFTNKRVVKTKAVGFGFCARVSGRDKAEVPR